VHQLNENVLNDLSKYSHSCLKVDDTLTQNKLFSSSNDWMLFLWAVIVDTQHVEHLSIFGVYVVSEDLVERAIEVTKMIQGWYEKNIFYCQALKAVSESDWDDLLDKDKKSAQFKENFNEKEL
jgi:hypothetical protein